MTTENQVKTNALAQVLAGFHKANLLEKSGLDVNALTALVLEVHKLSFAAGLRVEVLCTPDLAHKDYRTTTLRVLSGNLCVHSQVLR